MGGKACLVVNLLEIAVIIADLIDLDLGKDMNMEVVASMELVAIIDIKEVNPLGENIREKGILRNDI